MNLNKVVVGGRLGKDPELKSLPSGVAVVNFSVAASNVYKDKQGQKQETTEWFNCVAFGRTAEVINQYFTKGKEIYLEGRLQTRSWEAEGKKNYRTEVVVDSFQFVGGGSDDGATRAPRAQSTSNEHNQDTAPQMDTIEYPQEDINPDDIPF